MRHGVLSQTLVDLSDENDRKLHKMAEIIKQELHIKYRVLE